MDAHTHKALARRILKVNHAGENGAVNIYAGQIFFARLTAPGMVCELQEFKNHEECHRQIFEEELIRRDAPRCRSYLLCGFGGYALGLLTGLMGSGAIAATTVAVEQVVLRHLKQQLQELQGIDEAAVIAIRAIVNEEQDHHDRSVAHAKSNRFWSQVLLPIVARSTELVIWTGMRV